VAGQNLTAGSADSRPIALEAIEDAENVVVVVLDQLLAITIVRSIKYSLY
jgi:hypothetical protein